MDLEVAWNGTLDRQAIAAQQKPAPKVQRSVLPSHTALLALFQAQPRRHWTHKELVSAMQRDRDTVRRALLRVMADGDVQQIVTGINPQRGAAMRFVLAERMAS